MRRISIAATFALVACASGGASSSPAADGGRTSTTTQEVVTVPGTETRVDMAIQSTRYTSSAVIGKPVEEVWAVLPDIWTSLGLTYDGISPKEHRLSSGVIRVRRMLGGVNLSRYVECGRSTLGQNADSYFIALKVETVMSAAANGTLVQSGLQATGEGTGNGGQPMRCSSTGELENRIAERLQKRLP